MSDNLTYFKMYYRKEIHFFYLPFFHTALGKLLPKPEYKVSAMTMWSGKLSN